MSGRSGKFIQTLTIDATMQVDGIKRAISELESAFKGMNVGKDMEKTMAALKTNLENFAQVASKEIKDVAGAKEFEHSWQKVESSLDGVAAKLKAMGMNPDKLIPKETFTKIANLQKKITDFQAASQQKDTSIKYLNEELKKAEENSQKLRDELKSLAEIGENGEIIPLKYTKEGLEEAKRKVDEIQAEIDKMSAARKLSQENAEKKYGYDAKEFSSLPRQIEEQREAINKAKASLKEYENGYNNLGQIIEKTQQEIAESDKKVEHFKNTIKLVNQEFNGKWGTDALKKIKQELSELTGKDLKNTKISGLKKLVDELAASESEKLKPAIEQVRNALEGCEKVLGDVTGESRKWFDGIKDGFNNAQDFSKQVEALTNQVTQFFSLTNGWNLLRRAIRSAVDVVKELDEAMTGIAVVSKYDLTDIWGMRGDFVKEATAIGVSTLDLVNATTLYTQQGLELGDAMKVAVETMKMGRIAGLEGEEATEKMTAALRGYNMELTEASHVNDVYSNLAAKTASNQEQLATAMSRTASIAYNSGASFENMSAFLAQIIETTQEAPETAGTAMKTIIARFQELKKPLDEIGEVEGEVVDANKIETALRQAGVALRDVNGEFRDFDDVILELSSKWDGLDKMTQRYIATMAAGSRQQSRFIALLNNNERLLELTGYAANSAGKSQEQFNKTLESFQSKLAKLHNEMDQFYTNLMNNNIIKLGMDIATQLLHILNEIITPLSNSENLVANFAGALIELGIVAIAFRGALVLLQKGATKAAEGMTKFTLSNLLSVLGLKKNTKATKENVKATATQTATQELANKAKLQAAAALGAQIVEEEVETTVVTEEAAATVTATVAKKAYTLETIKQTIATNAFLTTLLKIIGPLAAIIAALGAFALIIKSVDDAHFTQAEQMESYQKSVNDTNDSLQSLQEQEEAVATSLKNIEDGKKSLKALTEGTAEWYEQLRNTNQEILNLINKIPALANYLQFMGNGAFDLTGEGYDFLTQYQENLKKQQEIAGRSLIRQQRDVRSVELEKENEKYREDAIAALREVVKPAAQPGGEKNPHYSHTVLEDILDGKVEINLPDEAKAIIENYNTQLLASTKELESWNDQLGATYGEDRFDQLVGSIIESETSEMSKAMSQLISEGEAEIPGIFAQSSYGLYSSSESVSGGKRLANKEDFLKYYGSLLKIEDIDSLDVKSLDGIKKIYTAATGLAADADATYDDIFKVLTNNYVEFTRMSAEQFDLLTDKQKEGVVAYYDLMDGKIEDMTVDQINAVKSIFSETQTALKIVGDSEIENEVQRMKERNKLLRKDQKVQLSTNLAKLYSWDPLAAYEAANAAALTKGLYGQKYELHLEDINNILSDANFTNETKKIFVDVLPRIKEEDLDQVLGQIQAIDFSSPITAYGQIKALASESDPYLKGMYNTMLEQENISFSEQIKELDTLGDESNNLSDELDKIIESNGKITADDVKKLSKSYQQLNGFMKNTNVNASTLAKTLTGIKQGKFSIDSVTDAVILAISKFGEVDELINKVHNDITSFDAGPDTSEAENFLTTAYDNIQQHLDNYDFGNPQIDNYINKIWGPDLLGAAEDYSERLDIINEKQALLSRIKETNSITPWFEELAAAAENAGEEWEYAWKIIDNGEDIWLNTDNFTGDLKTLTKEFAEAFKLPQETAELLLDAWGNESPDFSFNMKRAGYEEGLQTFVDNATVTNSKDLIVSLEEINALAAASAQSTDKIKADLEEAAKQRGGKFKISVDLSELQTAKEVYDSIFTGEDPLLNAKNYLEGQTLNLDAMLGDLKSRFNLDPGTANEVASQVMEQLNGQFENVTYEGLPPIPADKLKIDGEFTVGKQVADNIVKDIEDSELKTAITEDILDALKEDYDVKFSADEALEMINTQLDNAAKTERGLNLTVDQSAITSAISTAIGSSSGTVKLDAQWSNTGGDTLTITATGSIDTRKGGTMYMKIPRHENGTRNVSKQYMALLGEGAGPELVQTKDGAYIAGINGPEIGMIHPGDIVYSNDETKKIFGRGGFKIPGYDNGYNMPRYAVPSSHITKPGSGGDNSTTDNTNAVDANTEATKENTEKWENSIDFLTRQVSRLEAYTNKRELLEKERDNLIERGNVGWRDLVRFQNEIVDTLKLEIAQRKENLDRSRKELQDIRVKAGDDTFNGQSIRQFVDYIEGQGLLYNKEMVDAFIKKYEGTDQEEDAKAFYERIQDYISQFENIGGKIDENLKGIREGEAELIKAEQEFKDAALEMEERITDAIVNERQRQIDDLSNNYEAINTANDNLLDALQQGIEDMRAQREQEKAAADLQKSERQLALMSMDTSGANKLDILKTQESLDDQRQSYTDSLIDKSIEQMTRDNEKAAQQREQQIALMEAQLQYDIDNGIIAAQADELLHAMERNSQSMIEKVERLIKLNEDYNSKGILNRQDFVTELGNQISEAQTYLNREPGASNAVTNFTRSNGMKDNTRYETNASNTKLTTSLYTGAKNTTVDAVNAKLDPLLKKYSGKFKPEGGLNNDEEVIARGIYGSWWAGGSGWTAERVAEKFGDRIAARVMAIRQSFLDKKTDPKNWPMSVSDFHRFKYDQFETGGLADFTGPAWLDGTKSKPEYVLNADQTKRFFDLLDFTKDIGNDNNSTLIGDTYYNISMSNEIASDYDVDNMWDEMQRKIYENAAYRNVQSLNFGRR